MPVLLGLRARQHHALLGVGSASDSLSVYPRTAPVTSGSLYVDSGRASSGDGQSLATAFRTLQEGLNALADGQRLIVRGDHTLTSRLSRSTAWATGVEVFAYGSERPVISGADLPTGASGRLLYFHSGSRREHWKGFEFRDGKDRGVQIEGSEITLEDAWVRYCQGEGIYVLNGDDNRIIDPRVWRLGDGATPGTNSPDCIAFTAVDGDLASRNLLIRPMAANGPDDCIDLFRAANCRVIDGVAIGAGFYWNGVPAGDGNGYKMGGENTGSGDNHLLGSLAAGCNLVGVNNNSSNGVKNLYRNNTAYANQRGFITDRITLPDHYSNLTYANPTYDTSVAGVQVANSWQDVPANPDPLFGDPAAGDLSLLPGSPALGTGDGGAHKGASTVALEIYKEWANHPEIHNPAL